MAKHKYYITVPMTGSVNIVVEVDEPIEDADQAFELACEKWNDGEYALDIVDPKENGEAELGEFDLHPHLNRGNVCHAVCPEIDWVKES